MCGFFSFIGKFNLDDNILKKSIKDLSHRGPDNQKIYNYKNNYFGFCRLSINDLSSNSDQPIQDNEHVMVFNGEIYNFKQLIKKYSLKDSSSDTLTLFNLLKLKGKEIISELNGMFSIVFFNKIDDSFFAARDRMGQKPLLYLRHENGYVFSSEIKILINFYKHLLNINTDQIFHFMKFLHLSPHKTIFKNVQVVKPAEIIEYKNGKITNIKYWDPIFKINQKKSSHDFIIDLKEKMDSSIKKHLISDVEVGAFLSGGIDSSIIVARTSNLFQEKKIKTFSFGYKKNSELSDAKIISDLFNTEHFEINEKELNVADELINISHYYDEPFADSANISTYFLSKFASNFVKVCIGGDGGDELFGGYINWYNRYRDYKNFIETTNPSYSFSKMISKIPIRLYNKSFFHRKFIDQYNLGNNFISNYLCLRSHTSNEILNSIGLETNNNLLNDLNLTDTNDDFNNIFEIDLKFYLPADILNLKDKATMATSLEMRSPFLDNDLVDLSLTIPHQLKIKDRFYKKILFDAYSNDFSKLINFKAKQGFGAPIVSWLKRKDVNQLFNDVVLDSNNKMYNYLDFKNVKKITKKNNYTKWALLNLGIWFNTWQ
tara:strand:+ start:128 stop:1933 length:1806 start_codon:yes stop_codon:yes gene_type:complete